MSGCDHKLTSLQSTIILILVTCVPPSELGSEGMKGSACFVAEPDYQIEPDETLMCLADTNTCTQTNLKVNNKHQTLDQPCTFKIFFTYHTMSPII